MAETRAEILTEIGTNELEVVEFLIDDRPYAINVAKVREIIRPQRVMAIPESPPAVLGVFRNREDVVPLLDLGRWLGCEGLEEPGQAKVIVAEFNQMRVGFLVHGVRRIHRLSWADLETSDRGGVLESRAALGFVRVPQEGGGGERIIFLLDFEQIVAELAPERGGASLHAKPVRDDRRSRCSLLIAEDSGLIRKMIVRTLEEGGYETVSAENGVEAWETLEGGAEVHAVISDIEMPRMDGHHLTRKIKEDPRFRHLPVILYSSMINDELRRKGQALGADAQLCKPDLPHLVDTVDGLLGL